MMKNDMKTFDWEIAKQSHRLETLEYLRATHNKKITEDEFVAGMKDLKLPRQSPSHCKQMYRSLKEKFGFFNG